MRESQWPRVYCLAFSLALFTTLNVVKVAWLERKQRIAKATRACNCLLVLKSLQLHRLFSDRALFWSTMITARRRRCGCVRGSVCVCVGGSFGSIRPPLLLPILHSLSHFFSFSFLPASSLSLSQALPHALFTILTHSVIWSFISFHFLAPCLSGVEITAAPYSWLAPYVSHLLNCRICLVWHSDPSANKLCDPYLPTHAEPIFYQHNG